MISSTLNRITSPAVRTRRMEIGQRLVACGLARGPRRLFRPERETCPEHAAVERLRVALEDLGPIFSSFGLYMSARADLWPVRYCLEFANIPDEAPAIPSHLVGKFLRDSVDWLPEQTFEEFEATPFESRLRFQSHYARLDGNEVIVKIIHPEIQSQLLADLDLIPLLKDSFAGCGLTESAFKTAAADFCHTFRQQMDFNHESHAYEALARDADDYDVLRVPRVIRPLSTSKVLVVERLEGLRLDEILLRFVGPDMKADHSPLESIGLGRTELARLLCEAWLRQAFFGRSYPVEPLPENILVLRDKGISFTGGAFAVLPPKTQSNLWDYLLAAANDDADKACSALLSELRMEAAGKGDVRQRFRQAMPFRDGGWEAGDDHQTLSELLLVQWRLATECGYAPLMHLPAFYRGLFRVANIAKLLDENGDPLADGVRDVRLIAGLAQFSKMWSQRQLVEQMDRYAALMVDLPHNLDEAMTFGAEGLKRNSQATPVESGRSAVSSTGLTTLLVILGAVVFWAHYIKPLMASSAWSNRINAVIFLTFGALLVRAVSRVR